MNGRRFSTAWDVAKWIEVNVKWREQGHRDPMDAALWYQAAQMVESTRDMNGRELVQLHRDGMTPTHPDDITNDINARYEDIEHDESIVEKDAEIDNEIESALRDFWFGLRGER